MILHKYEVEKGLNLRWNPDAITNTLWPDYALDKESECFVAVAANGLFCFVRFGEYSFNHQPHTFTLQRALPPRLFRSTMVTSTGQYVDHFVQFWGSSHYSFMRLSWDLIPETMTESTEARGILPFAVDAMT